MKIALCLAHGGAIKTATHRCIVQAMLHAMATTEHGFILLEEESCYVQWNRHTLATKAFANGADAVFFYDWDMVFPPDVIPSLLAHDKEIVGVDYARRTTPRQTTLHLLPGTEPQPTLYEVGGVGTGCVLIRRSAFEKAAQPWFNVAMDPVTGEIKCGEDQWFMNQARLGGAKVYCDPTIKVIHIGDYPYE